jgi:predicted Zn-dependent peptidase
MPVVMERMKNLRSVSFGIWVKAGSRYETADKNGISHFLEHMFFKGTTSRTALEIATEIDGLGGELNAFTSKEGTTFYIKVLDEFLDQGVALLEDMFLNSSFPDDEIEREKDVVIEEIKMVQDTPDDYIHDLFSRSVWGKTGLGQTILGSPKAIRSFNRKDLLSHIDKFYGTLDVVVACAGNFDEKRLIGLLNKGFGRIKRGKRRSSDASNGFRSRTEVHSKELSEVHICMGVKGIPQASTKRYCALLLNTVLGGGISSRLFQEIREKRGLAYSVYSFLSSYRDEGLWGIYAGTSKRKFNEVISRCADELMGLASSITEDELRRAKAHLKGNIMLALESTSRRMQNIASQEIYYGKHITPKEIMESIDAVSLDEAKALSDEMTESGGVALTVLGPADKKHLKAKLP